jgi:hypothetical protein
MREIFGAFSSEVFRPLMTILLPGVVALSTWIIGLLQNHSVLRELLEAKRVESAILVFLSALALGEVIEDLGSRIEYRYDKRQENKNPEFTEEWYRYLALAFEIEPVGHRYLKTLVLRLKFQLGLGIGIIFAGAGTLSTSLTSQALWCALMGCGITAVYLLWEARETHELLGEVRREMLKRVNRRPEAPKASLASSDGAEIAKVSAAKA